jgi:hypothetical protein
MELLQLPNGLELSGARKRVRCSDLLGGLFLDTPHSELVNGELAGCLLASCLQLCPSTTLHALKLDPGRAWPSDESKARLA